MSVIILSYTSYACFTYVEPDYAPDYLPREVKNSQAINAKEVRYFLQTWSKIEKKLGGGS